jgi:hypothetical protein
MIKNNKGFVITEVLILSTVIMGVLVFMYTQFKAINRGYQYSFKYDTPQGLYLANNIINYINDGNYDKLVELLNNTPKGYLDITECNIDNSNLISYCNTLFQKSDIEKIIFTKEDLKDIKRNIIDFDNDFKEYIKQISVLNDEADYRIIIKYKNGTFASMRFNKGNAYVQDGLITYLDAVNNTGYGHSDETQIWKDLTNHGNDATLYNNPIWSNNSIIFDGETNFGRIEATANLSYETGITIEARLKILSTEIFNDENEIPFLGNWHGAGLGLLYLEEGTFDSNFYTTNGLKNFNNTETNNINEYTTVTMTHDGTKATLYINGVQKAIINNTNTITPSLVPIGIGGNPKIENTSMDSYANVEFQNVLIYDRALTENEVMRNYQADMAKY